MKAQIITDRQLWNTFIANSEGCNVTQTYEWGELMSSRAGEMLPIGVLNDEGELCAAMLIIISKAALLKATYFYAPRGPIIDNPETPAMDILLAFAKDEARKRHAFMLKIEPGVPHDDEAWLRALARRGFCKNPEARHLRHEWVLDLRPDEQKILAGMKKTWRYCVRLAGRKDVQIRHGSGPQDLHIFYTLLKTTSNRDTFFIYEESFYERLMTLYGERAKIMIAEYEGQPLAAALLVTHGRWCWYMYGASSNEHRDRMPNHLLQWTAFQWAKAQGCWYYNFRGIPDVLEEGDPMWGIYVFKSGFGGYAIRSLETQDLAYQPALYRLYRFLLSARDWYKKSQAEKRQRAVQQKKNVIKQQQQAAAGQSQQHETASAQPAVVQEEKVQAKATTSSTNERRG
ncbi:lipid II:glycine glycyltransferase FemX [Dictyobacter arantiisoli]|nr:peptidoglycan bridge formation glycyltransferase FemA/FemB family protein [Dictyobacter arantiisoli]